MDKIKEVAANYHWSLSSLANDRLPVCLEGDKPGLSQKVEDDAHSTGMGKLVISDNGESESN